MSWIKKYMPRHYGLLIASTIVYASVMIIFSAWKYITNKYNGLDLAIYNQVFWNLSHGHGLYSSIQAGNYFGDHAEFFIFPLLPFYKLFPHPLTLLTLQTIALASTIFPIYFLANFIFSLPSKQKQGCLQLNGLWNIFKKSLAGRRSMVSSPEAKSFSPESEVGLLSQDKRTDGFLQNVPQSSSLPLLLSLLWLINPIVWNINFFEFHILPFAIPFLLWTIYFYFTGRLRLYYLFLLASLTIREDVSLVTAMLGITIIFSGCTVKSRSGLNGIANKKHGLITLLISGFYFLAVIRLIQYFSVEGNYKFMVYYGWLGDSLKDTVATMLENPIMIVRHITTLPNFEMILGFSMAFLFLPLIAPLFLVLVIPPLFQFLLKAGGGGALVFQTHYASLFLPGLITAFIFGLQKINKKFDGFRFSIMLILIVGSIYNFLALGPIIPALQTLGRDIKNREWRAINQLIGAIPRGASVGAIYLPLTKLSSRQNLQLLHYLYVGKKQFSNVDFTITEPPEYLVIDEDEFKTFKAQYESLVWSAATAPSGFTRIQSLIDYGSYGEMARINNVVILEKDSTERRYLLPQIPENLTGYITLNGIRSIEIKITEK